MGLKQRREGGRVGDGKEATCHAGGQAAQFRMVAGPAWRRCCHGATARPATAAVVGTAAHRSEGHTESCGRAEPRCEA
eukprot:242021-Chlamydomonas_euryale.AAC.5